MEINKGSLMDGGFISNQHLLKDIPFGKYTVAEKGCGFIALYNALVASGKNPDADSVLSYINKWMFMGGRFGTTLIPMMLYLAKFGIKPRLVFCQDKFEDCNIGIAVYKTTSGWWHYAMFRDVGGGCFQFINILRGMHSNFMPMDEFCEKHVDRYIYMIKVK